jgi:hypothetical protein
MLAAGEAEQTTKTEAGMLIRRDFVLLLILPAVIATPASGQTSANAPAETARSAAPIPGFSGIWWHPFLPGIEPLASGPTSVRNLWRRKGVSNYDQLVGDYTNPILQPWASEVVRKFGELSKAGVTYPSPANQCWPEPLPYIYKNTGLLLLQQPHQVTLVYNHEFRQVRLNGSHPAKLTPSWHGDAVGRYEGDTLVVDTLGQKHGPFAMLDLYGTPYSEKLHVVERYRLIDSTKRRTGWSGTQRRTCRPVAHRRSTVTIGASTCRSCSRSRTSTSSPCPGQRPSPTGAAPMNGENRSAPKIRMTTFPTGMWTSRPRTGRISDRL